MYCELTSIWRLCYSKTSKKIDNIQYFIILSLIYYLINNYKKWHELTGQKNVLDNICGRFPPNQLIAIMGPSGAGKSSLLDVLSGYR